MSDSKPPPEDGGKKSGGAPHLQVGRINISGGRPGIGTNQPGTGVFMTTVQTPPEPPPTWHGPTSRR